MKKTNIKTKQKSIKKIPLHSIVKVKGQYPKELKGKTFKEVIKKYSQPEWCSYPDAIEPLGCWSLIGFWIQSRDDCRGCDLSADRIACEKNPVIL